MRLYAQHGRVRSIQILSDVVLLAWCLIWAFLGRSIFGLVNGLRGPAEDMNSAAIGLSQRVDSINDNLPAFLQRPLESIGTSANTVGDAANAQADSISHVANILGWTTALIPISLALLLAAFFRIRWNLRVRAATRLAPNPNFEELLARRAAMHQPLGALAKVSANPLQDLRDGNFGPLARLELAELGVDPAPHATKAAPPRTEV